jgi:Tol biopolymer transport system component
MGRVGAPAPAPDGRFAIVPVTTWDLAANKGTDVLHYVEPGREPRALTAPERGSARDPAVSPDGKRVAFVRCRSGRVIRSGCPTGARW